MNDTTTTARAAFEVAATTRKAADAFDRIRADETTREGRLAAKKVARLRAVAEKAADRADDAARNAADATTAAGAARHLYQAKNACCTAAIAVADAGRILGIYDGFNR